MKIQRTTGCLGLSIRRGLVEALEVYTRTSALGMQLDLYWVDSVLLSFLQYLRPLVSGKRS